MSVCSSGVVLAFYIALWGATWEGKKGEGALGERERDILNT
jgi:hypothetical protein